VNTGAGSSEVERPLVKRMAEGSTPSRRATIAEYAAQKAGESLLLTIAGSDLSSAVAALVREPFSPRAKIEAQRAVDRWSTLRQQIKDAR
jgi:hypothetical protein